MQSSPQRHFSEPARLTLKYLLLAGLWIVGSDYLMQLARGGEPEWNLAGTLKGLFFVAITGAVLHALARRMQSRMRGMEEMRRRELQEANARIERSRGLHAVLARANQAVLTASDEKQLFDEIGDALVGLGGLRFVWFSRVDEATGEVRAVAWAGGLPEYLDNLRCSVRADSEFGHGPTGRAIREGRVVTCRDMLSDPGLRPWDEAIRRRGFRSSACAPILADGRRGAISAYAGEPDYFNEELAELMSRLAKDIGHGLGLIAARNEKARLNERLHLMQTAIEAAPSGIVITDAVGRIEWVNPAFTRMTGYPLEAVAGRNPRLLKSGRQSAAFYEDLWNTISHGRIWSGDLQNMRRDGSVYWEHMVIAPVPTPTGAIEHYVAIKQDITSQKQMEQQVARTQRLESIGLLAGGIAHDLNNVLAPILMAMDLFKLRYPAAEDQSRFEMVRKSAERGAMIVRQVLAFARGMEGERMRLRPEHLIKEVRNLLCETLPRDIELPLEIEPDLPAITGDATQIHQVLLNLGVNARDAMRRCGGVLTFGARKVHLRDMRVTDSGLVAHPGDYVLISVKDTGSGIEPGVLERMFEPFFTTKPRGEGTGLGLSTALGIVRGHGGGMDVVTRPGEGTEFKVLLPAAPAEAAHAGTVAQVARPDGRGRAILIVDDEEPVRAVVAMALESSGFAHAEAADGAQAIELFEKNPQGFSAVILDRVMPRMGGEEVARRIKAARPELPIILTSGLLSDPQSKSDDGAADYRKLGDVVLRKPFSQPELLGALQEVLERKPAS